MSKYELDQALKSIELSTEIETIQKEAQGYLETSINIQKPNPTTEKASNSNHVKSGKEMSAGQQNSSVGQKDKDQISESNSQRSEALVIALSIFCISCVICVILVWFKKVLDLTNI